MMGTATILTEVLAERIRQDEKWGEQNHPDIYQALWYPAPKSDEAKALCDVRAKARQISYTDILLEELAEAVDEARAGNKQLLRDELIQVAAVSVAWIEKLDRGL